MSQLDVAVREAAIAETPDYPPIETYPVTEGAAMIWDEITRLDLTYHVAELEIKGYTVIPPEKVAPPGYADKLLDAAMRLADRRIGGRPTPDMTEENTPPELKWAFGLPMSYPLLEEPLFQDALLNPVGLAMTTYMLGVNALLSACTVMLKGPGGVDNPLHADSFRLPDPLPALPQICNITWALTDYTKENGAISFVPGSHKFLRRPLTNEGIAEQVPCEAKAGSLIVFNGMVWHGAFKRTNPGFRCALSYYMCRPHLLTEELYNTHVPQEIIDRHPPRFATLMGRKIHYGWKEEGPGAHVETSAGESSFMGKHAWD